MRNQTDKKSEECQVRPVALVQDLLSVFYSLKVNRSLSIMPHCSVKVHGSREACTLLLV